MRRAARLQSYAKLLKQNAGNAKDTADEGKKTTPITLTPEKRPTDTAKSAQPTRNISFDSIKFPMEKQELFKLTMLTPQVKALDGRRVKIRGFMLPSFVNRGLKYFVLVRDNQECCFGPGAALFDAIHIDLAEGVTAEYSYPPIAVEGMFHIDPVENPLLSARGRWRTVTFTFSAWTMRGSCGGRRRVFVRRCRMSRLVASSVVLIRACRDRGGVSVLRRRAAELSAAAG